ncbi:hypothetical protein [Corynebacterium sp. Marseille-Q2823]|uniref:hypothetical protein n=1 Tax=Corynebacterium sp. Marseille-Q2823 TaxID=2736606 RepID=UPI00158D3C94|nr:hypothetical protein [Corynebacterium sp. Marseille-Q2823]
MAFYTKKTPNLVATFDCDEIIDSQGPGADRISGYSAGVPLAAGAGALVSHR